MTRCKYLIISLLALILLLCGPVYADQPITFSPPSIILSAGLSQKVDVSGVRSGEFSIGGFDAEIVEATLEGRTLRVEGKKQGNTIVFVVDNQGKMAGLRVSIREAGAEIPFSLKIEVSGRPVTEALIREAVKETIKRKTVLKEGVTLIVSEKRIKGLQPLEPGQWAMLTVPVIASGNHYTSQERDVSVVVTNINLPYKEDSLLLMSNNPEVITGEGLLFRETITKGESARLIYHHMNELQGPPRVLRVILKNPSTKPAKVFTHKGIGGPNIDALFAGHVATKRFIINMVNKSGQLLEIPPGGEIVLIEQSLRRSEDSVTGIVKIWLVQGEKIQAEVNAYETVNNALLDFNPQQAQLLSLDGLAGHVRGVFPNPRVRWQTHFDTRDRQMSIKLGLTPKFHSQDRRFLLIGNYGVRHDIQVKVRNPTDQTKEVRLFCIPSGGLARGIFLIENELLETGILDPHVDATASFKTFFLPPHSQKDLLVTTMPQSGSYYPIKLVFWSS